MAQRAPLRVQVPALGSAALGNSALGNNSPSYRLSKYQSAFAPSPSPSPLPVMYQRPSNGWLWISVFLQLSSLYVAHQWLLQPQHQQNLPQFAFLAFFGGSLALGFLQRPWKGRAISSSQWLMVFVSGALFALSFFLRMRGLANVGPLETILAEYAGAVVGKVLLMSQRKVLGIGEAKVRGVLAFLAGLYFLSHGWAFSSCSPLSSLLVPASKTRMGKIGSARLTRATRIGYTAESRAYISGGEVVSELERDCAKYAQIIAPIFAGLLSSMQKFLPSRTGLANLPRKRVQALTYVAAAAFFIPVALFQLAFMDRPSGGLDLTVLWPLFSVVGLGMVAAFYGDFFSEEKLLVSQLSPFHFFVTTCGVCLWELIYGSNFSLSGFVFCAALLAIGVRAGAFISGGLDWNSISEKDYSGLTLLAMIKTPVYHIWTDLKTRKIAMFLLLNSSFMVVEFVYGFLSNSLGLISDACHMLFDCAALAIGLYASYISRLPSNSRFNFGYGRFEVLSGFANAVFLILVASLIVLESIERLLEPPEISTESLLVVSVGGFLVNVVGLIFFHEAHHHAHGSAPCTHAHHKTQEKVPALASSTPSESFHVQVPTPVQEGGFDRLSLHLQESPSFRGFAPEVQSPSAAGGSKSSSHVHTGANLLHRSSEPTFAHHNSGLQADRQFAAHIHANAQRPSQQQPSPEQSHLHVNHEHHAHTGGCSEDHNHRHHHHHHHHSDDASPESAKQPHSPTEHQHSKACEGSHDHWHNQKNPFVQQCHSQRNQHSQDSHSHSPEFHRHNSFVQHSHSHDKPEHSEPGLHIHGQHCDHPEAHAQHSGKHIAQNHGEDHSAGNFMAVTHHHEAVNTEVSGSSGGDQAAGHIHLHGGQPCSLDHGHIYSHGEHHPDHNQQGHHHHQHESHDEPGYQHVDHNHDSNQKGHGNHNLTYSSSHGGDHSHNHIHDGHHQHHDHDHRDLLHSSCQGGDHVHDHSHDKHHHHHDHNHLGHETDSHDHHGHNHHDHDHHGHDHEDGHHQIDHNMEGIFLHILADTLGSVGVVISTLLIKYKGWLFTDPACSIFISLLIVSSVLPLFRNSAELLLQRVPRSAEKRIQKALEKVGKVDGVHDWHKLHVWSYTNSELVGTLRLHASIGADKHVVHKKVSRILQDAGVLDLTLEVEELEVGDDS